MSIPSQQSQPQSLFQNICPMCVCIPPNDNTSVTLLDANTIPKYTTSLPLPQPIPYNLTNNNYKIGLGKTNQQILPI